MSVLKPTMKSNRSVDPEKSIIFDFPDSEEGSTTKVTTRKKMSRTRRKRSSETEVEKENKQLTGTQNLTLAEKNSVCPICRLVFTEDVDSESRTLHISQCAGLTSKVKMATPAVEQPGCSKNEVEVSSEVCPVCNKAFLVGEDASAREIHTNKCLDLSLREDIPEQAKTDELLARSLQHEETINTRTFSDPHGADFCQVCSKNISKYSIQQRAKHMNGCMDKVEKLEGKSKRKNPGRKAKSAQPRASKIPKKPCPICKAEQPEKKYDAHVKKCANKNKIAPHQMLKMITENKINVESEDVSTVSGNQKGRTIVTSVVKPSELNLMDRSLVEEHRKRLTDMDGEDEYDIPATPALPKCNIAQTFKRQEHVSVEKDSSPASTSYQQDKKDAIVIEEPKHVKKPCRLWDLASYKSDTFNTVFLLTTLHPGICADTPVKQNNENFNAEENHDQETIRDKLDNSPPPASTTTSPKNAEAASPTNDIINIDSNSNESFTATQFDKLDLLMNLSKVPSNNQHNDPQQQTGGNEILGTDGFIADKIEEKLDVLQKESRKNIMLDYESLVASPAFSDFTFHCNHSEDVPAHKVMLATRCAVLKKYIDDVGNSMKLHEYSSSAVKKCMRFIYTAQLPEATLEPKEDIEGLHQLADRFHLKHLSEACTLLNSRFAEQNNEDDNNNSDKIGIGEGEDLDLNQIVSSFWQHEDIEADIHEQLSETEDNNVDSCFSDDEIAEMREVFQSQTQNLFLSVEEHKTEGEGIELEAPDECFFVPDINKTLERSKCSSEDEDGTRSQLEGGLLGDSPRRAAQNTNEQKITVNDSPKKFDEPEETNLHFELPKNRSQSTETAKCSLEVVAPSSPRPELSIDSNVAINLNSYSSSVGSSAYADTQPLEENINNDPQEENKKENSKGPVTLKIKRPSNGDLSVVTATYVVPEVIDLDETSQERTKTREVTSAGTTHVSDDDFDSMINGYNGSVNKEINNSTLKEHSFTHEKVGEAIVECHNVDSSSSTEGSPNVVVVEKEVVNKSQEILFSATNDAEETGNDTRQFHNRTDVSRLHNPNQTIDATPLVLSCETPCIHGDYNQTRPDETYEGYTSNHSLDDVEIPGLNLDNSQLSVIARLSYTDEMKTNENVTVVENENYQPDFKITATNVGDTLPNITIDIDTDTQDDTMATTVLPSNNASIRSPCVLSQKKKVETSTPCVLTDGATKRKFLLHKMNTESPIPQNLSKNESALPAPVTPAKSKSEESPKIVIVDSPENVSPQTCPQISAKRKVISSATESLSSGCESVDYGKTPKQRRKSRQRKRAKPMSESFSATSLSRVPIRNTVAETSSSDGGGVSESDAPSLFASRKPTNKSPYKRKNIGSFNSSWLSKNDNRTTPNSKGASSSKNTSALSLSSQSKRTKRKRKPKKPSPKVRNADFKELLSKHRSSQDSDSDHTGRECMADADTQSDVENDGHNDENFDNNLSDCEDVIVSSEGSNGDKKDNQQRNDNLQCLYDKDTDSEPNGDKKDTLDEDNKENDKSKLGHYGDNSRDELKSPTGTIPNKTNVSNNADAENCGDNENEYDEPYHDEDDMYFMDDGGYNSFNLEMPPGINSQKTDKNTSGDKSYTSMTLRNTSVEHETSKGLNSTKETFDGKTKHEILTNTDNIADETNECIISNLHQDSFNVSDLKDLDCVSVENPLLVVTVTTPKSKHSPPECTFKTPVNPPPSGKQRKMNVAPTAATLSDDSFETPTPPPTDKEACKNFPAGCSKHPETSEAITPMPNFDQIPTPNLKAEMKKYAIREISKNKMVSKLKEVYKYQHGFSHWEEEPPKPTRKRKVKATETEVPATNVPTDKNVAAKPKKTKKGNYAPICLVSGENCDDVTSSQKEDEGNGKKNKSKKEKKQPATEEEILSYIQNTTTLYQKILSFEPIDFNELVEELEQVPMAVNKQMLVRLLDGHCICNFTKKENAVKPTKKRGRPKKK